MEYSLLGMMLKKSLENAPQLNEAINYPDVNKTMSVYNKLPFKYKNGFIESIKYYIDSYVYEDVHLEYYDEINKHLSSIKKLNMLKLTSDINNNLTILDKLISSYLRTCDEYIKTCEFINSIIPYTYQLSIVIIEKYGDVDKLIDGCYFTINNFQSKTFRISYRCNENINNSIEVKNMLHNDKSIIRNVTKTDIVYNNEILFEFKL